MRAEIFPRAVKMLPTIETAFLGYFFSASGDWAS